MSDDLAFGLFFFLFFFVSTEAWQEQDIDGAQLQKGITVAITASKSRQRVKRCRENKRYRAQLEQEQQVDVLL